MKIKKRLALSMKNTIDVLLKPVYKIYEWWLWNQIREGTVPKHVGIIPDGNRRWARLSGWDSIFGHEKGYEKMKQVLEWIWESGIRVVTIYAMSKENCCKRKPEERMHLFGIIKRGFEELLVDERIDKWKIKVRVIGRLNLVPEEVVSLAKKIEEKTSKYNERILYIALCYGGRDEIIEATKKIVLDYEKGIITLDDLDENVYKKYLFTSDAPDPDLIIRTSGEERISNFLLWQSAYSELYFTDAFWPEFRKIDLWRAIRSYQKRERRFGR